ncbi:MAG: DUF4333 domain-containing protein [Thermosynechococcaceae cyanobacterium]
MKSLANQPFPALTLVAGLSLLTACTPKLNIEKLEGLVKKEFAEQTGIAVKAVTCPEDIKIEAENAFDCDIEAEDGQKLKAKVTQKDDEGNVKWDANEGLISLTAVEQSIQDGFQKQKANVTADCGGKFKIAFQGDTFTCAVKDAKDQMGEVEVTVNDNKGSINWKLLKS